MESKRISDSRSAEMATLTLSASFHVWANQAKLTMYEIEN